MCDFMTSTREILVFWEWHILMIIFYFTISIQYMVSEVKYKTISKHGIKLLNPIALRKAKIVCIFGLSECNRINSSSCTCTVDSC